MSNDDNTHASSAMLSVEPANRSPGNDELQECRRVIGYGWIMVCVWCGITLLVGLAPLLKHGPMTPLAAGFIVTALLLAGLAFGIHQRSRVAAVVMMVCLVSGFLATALVPLETLASVLDSPYLKNIVYLLLSFSAFVFFRTITATFRYHHLMKERGVAAP